MSRTKRHKVFISYHHDLDEDWKSRFVRMMGDRIIDKSIYLGEIVDTNYPTADTLRHIREGYISEASVAVVLVGPRTWQRKVCRLGDWRCSQGYGNESEVRFDWNFATTPPEFRVAHIQSSFDPTSPCGQLFGGFSVCENSELAWA